MNHAGELLSAFIDGEADPAERRAVIRHLAECDVCRRELDEVSEIRRRLRELESPPVPAGLLAEEKVRRFGWLAGAAAVAVLLVGGVVAFRAVTPTMPAEELSVLLGAYTAAGPRVAAVVPATAARDREQVLELPPVLAELPRRDVRPWKDGGVLAYYGDGLRAVVVFVSPYPLDTSGLDARPVDHSRGRYLKAEGEGSVLYVWESDEAWLAVLAMAPENVVFRVLAELPPPDGGGLLWWGGTSP